MSKHNQPAAIAIVTGATRQAGIGAAICKELAQRGMDIFFTYWSAYDQLMPWSEGATGSEPELLQQQLRALGVRCEKLEADLSDIRTPAALLDAVERQLGAPSILVNNATFSMDTDYSALTADNLDRHYEINIRGTMLLSAEFARRFAGGSGGRIINLTSGQALGPMPGNLAYAATKAAVDGMTATLAAEVASKGITVNAVNPGPTDTGWMDDALKQELRGRFPMGRVGMPRDAARLIAFLASCEAEWITGQIIHSEGGFRRG